MLFVKVVLSRKSPSSRSSHPKSESSSTEILRPVERLSRAVQLPNGDLAVVAGYGTSKSAASRRFAAG